MNKYWEKRINDNLAFTDKLANSHMKRLQTLYNETLVKVDGKINTLYINMLKDGGITTTQ